jgi:LysR family glycine cleavage system transcriptional activator
LATIDKRHLLTIDLIKVSHFMTRRRYPLNSLRAFEASARHLSFVRAAEELHVTPAAVSHQVKRLEAYLGVQLFRRLPRGLLLAETGQMLLSELREVFLRLDKAMERVLESDSRGALTVSVPPMFAVKWLVPRLQRFDALHPNIDLRISSSLGVIDFQRDIFDAAVRLGHGQYRGLETVKLFDECVTAMCSPRLLEGPHTLRSPDDLRYHVLLHDDSMTFDAQAPSWKAWLNAANASRVDAARCGRSTRVAISGRGRHIGRTTGDTIQLAATSWVSLLLGVSRSVCTQAQSRDASGLVTRGDWRLKNESHPLQRSAQRATEAQQTDDWPAPHPTLRRLAEGKRMHQYGQKSQPLSAAVKISRVTQATIKPRGIL